MSCLSSRPASKVKVTFGEYVSYIDSTSASFQTKKKYTSHCRLAFQCNLFVMLVEYTFNTISFPKHLLSSCRFNIPDFDPVFGYKVINQLTAV